MLLRNAEDTYARTFSSLLRSVRSTGAPHIFVGSVAVHLYGVSSHDMDFDVCVPAAEHAKVRTLVEHAGFALCPGRRSTLYDPSTGLVAHFLCSGDFAGDRFRYPEIRLPDPAEAVERDGVPVPRLERLVELLLVEATADAWEAAGALVQVHHLGAPFELRLHSAVRGRYAELIGGLNTG